MINTIDKLNNADKEIHDILSRLRNLAKAFSITGNNTVSDELNRIVNRVAFYRNDMKNATNQLISKTTSQK